MSIVVAVDDVFGGTPGFQARVDSVRLQSRILASPSTPPGGRWCAPLLFPNSENRRCFARSCRGKLRDVSRGDVWLCEERGVVPTEAIEQATSRKLPVIMAVLGMCVGGGGQRFFEISSQQNICTQFLLHIDTAVVASRKYENARHVSRCFGHQYHPWNRLSMIRETLVTPAKHLG